MRVVLSYMTDISITNKKTKRRGSNTERYQKALLFCRLHGLPLLDGNYD